MPNPAARVKSILGLTFFALSLFLALPTESFAGDWPQILGAQRNGHASGETLAANWNEAKPTKAWSHAVGEGYAGSAIANGNVFVFHRRGNNEQLDCLNSSDGKVKWTTSWPSAYRGGINPDSGPRCVPIVANDRVYVFGAAGNLHCASVADGNKIWSRKLGKEYEALDGYFGFGSTPIIINDRIMANVGGKNGAGIVGLDLASGTTKWKAFDDAASYASPIEWKVNGDSIAIFITRYNLLGIQPSDGKVLFKTPFGARGATVNAATPIPLDESHLFITASYGIGAKLVSIEDMNPKVVWENDDSLSSQYPTPVLANGHLFGIHGREDGAAAALRCVKPQTGKVEWEQPDIGMAHIIAADGKLLVQTVEGELLLVAVDTQKYLELGSVRLSKATTRALPAFSNGLLVVRDTAGSLTAWSIPK